MPTKTASRSRGRAARATALLARVRRSRLLRANARFGAVGGGVLTGGIAYATLFGVAAALTLGWSVLNAVLGGDDELRDQVLDAVGSALPGLVDADGTGALRPADLRLSTGLTVAGAVAVVVMLASASSALSALRTGVRAVFGAAPGGNPVLIQLRALAGLVGLALVIVAAALLTVATTSAADWLLGAAGWGAEAGAAVRVLGLAVSFVVDAATFALVVVVLADQHPARRDLLGGALLAAAGIGVVRLLGTAVVAGSVARNPLLASAAVVATLLVWVNLMARIILLAAAWTGDPPFGPVEPPTADPGAPGVPPTAGLRTPG